MVVMSILIIMTCFFTLFRPGQLLSLRQCIKSIYRTDGVRGFYRGLTASYAGTIETAIYFVIYERLKQKFYLRLKRDLLPVECMVMAGVSKMIASTFCYPHGKWLP